MLCEGLVCPLSPNLHPHQNKNKNKLQKNTGHLDVIKDLKAASKEIVGSRKLFPC